MQTQRKTPKNRQVSMPYKGEAIARAAHVLRLFDRSQPERTLAELAVCTGIPKATLQGIVNTLTAHDLLMLDRATGRYRLGVAWLRLGDIRRNQLDIRKLALPLMQRMRATINETIILSLKVGDRRVHLDYVESTQTIRRVTQLGHEGPIHIGAAGLVLLAGIGDSAIDSYALRARLSADERESVLRSIAAIAHDGYAVAAGTVNIQTAAVAAPVKASNGETVAALTISCPCERFTARLRRDCIASVVENARRLSQSLGYQP